MLQSFRHDLSGNGTFWQENILWSGDQEEKFAVALEKVVALSDGEKYVRDIMWLYEQQKRRRLRAKTDGISVWTRLRSPLGEEGTVKFYEKH